MRYLLTCFLLIVLLFSITFAQDKASIAVLELEAGGISAYEAQVLSNRLRTELFKTGKFTVLERDKMDEILIEQGFQMSGCTTNECVVEVGKLIGVKQMVAGNIAKIDNLFTIDIRLIDVQTGKVLKTATEDCECELKDVLTNSIRNVSRTMAGLKIEDKATNVKTYQTTFQKPLSFENHPNYRSPSNAFWLSFFIPGVGQHYNGDNGKGIIQNVMFVGGILGMLFGDYVNYGSDGQIESEGLGPLFYIGVGVASGTWLWSWIDARASAIDYNNKLKKQLYGHLFEIETDNKIVGLDIGMKNNNLNGQVSIHF